jgi:hypothetical protein
MGFSAKLGYELPSLLYMGLSDLIGDLVGFEGRRFLELTPEPLTSRFECWYRRRVPGTVGGSSSPEQPPPPAPQGSLRLVSDN